METMQRYNSLRLRLPLTYALIALLVALATGLALLTILGTYYRQQENVYLQNSAEVIAANIRPLLENGENETVLVAHLEAFSFLTRSRVTFTSNDNAVQLAIDVFDPDTSQTATSQVFTYEAESGRFSLNAATEERLSVDADSADMTIDGVSVGDGTDSTFTLFAVAGSSQRSEPASQYQFTIVPTLYGYGIQEGNVPVSSTARSSQSVAIPISGLDGEILGTLRLSHGPAYGTEIVRNVAMGWFVASMVAVTLAVISGWVISRGISTPLTSLTNTATRMAEGNLSARVTIGNRDEFGQLANTFNHMADQVESMVTALQRFVSNAAHEIKTPLTALHTNLELASRNDDPDALKRALEDVERLTILASGLLELSRIESGVHRDRVTQEDVGALLRTTVGYFASRAEQADITLNVDIPTSPVLARINVELLRQAFMNVLDNALKFTPPGGTVTAQLKPLDRFVEIHIHDTGIGIPPDELPQLFSRFHRARNAFAYPGSGLGLAIVRAIMEQHHGTASIQNGVDGAHVTLSLPREEL